MVFITTAYTIGRAEVQVATRRVGPRVKCPSLFPKVISASFHMVDPSFWVAFPLRLDSGLKFFLFYS